MVSSTIGRGMPSRKYVALGELTVASNAKMLHLSMLNDHQVLAK